MKFQFIRFIALAAGAALVVGAAMAQEAVLREPGIPVYSPLAANARITGPVKIRLEVNPDGSVAGAAVESGPTMLAKAAQEAAKTSKFTCQSCERTSQYEMEYDFVLLPGSCGGHSALDGTSTIDSPHHITVRRDTPVMCDPVSTTTVIKHRSRSIRCLYLWKCGWRPALIQ